MFHSEKPHFFTVFPSMAKHQRASESHREKRIKRDSSPSPLQEDDLELPLVHLPEDVVENVLSFFPIRDAVMASTVAKRYKLSWHLNRKFLFGRDFALKYSREDLTALVDHVFDSHKGTQIQSFQLHTDPDGSETLIEKWLQICLQKGLENLEFFFFQPGFTIASGYLNGLKKLRTLKLVYCEIQVPPVLRGLNFLKTLVLWQLVLTEEMLETLVYHCKLLEILDLFSCSRIRQMNILARNHRYFKILRIAGCPDLGGIGIDSPTLRSIFYCGYIPRIRFAQGVALDEGFFNFMPTRTYMQASQVEILVHYLRHVRVLTTSALFPEALTARFRNGAFREPQYHLLNLRELQLFMEGGIFCNPYDIAVFLRNCPSLERLYIDLNDYHFDCGLYWNLHHKPKLDNFNHCFNRLKIVKLKGFKFLPSELVLVKFLLERAIFLELLVFITPGNGRTKLNLSDATKYNNLLHSWKVSPKVRILMYEPLNDKSGTRAYHPKYWY